MRAVTTQAGHLLPRSSSGLVDSPGPSVPIYHDVTKREWISRKCVLIRLATFIRAAISIPNHFWVRHEQANFFNSRGTHHYQLNADY
jgi:hypothetical protein